MNTTSRQFGPYIDGGGAPADAAGPVVTPKVKVSQATVDAIKSAGESKSYGATQYKGVSPEYVEGVKRIYPNAAKKAAAAAADKKAAQRPNSPGPSNLPPILPTPGKKTTPAKPNSPATMPPSMTPTSPRNAEKKAATPPKIKVSQATIDAIKKDGKTVSIGKVKNGSPGYNGSTFDKNAPVSAEYKEGVRRLYQSAAKPKPKAPANRGGGGGNSNVAM